MPIRGPIEAALWSASLATVGSSYGLLAMVGRSSWGRTSALRRGRAGPSRHDPRPPAVVRTSPITHVPALAGVAIAMVGCVAGASGASPLLVAALSMGGSTVAISGLWGRVTAVRVMSDRMVVHYAGRPPFPIPWSECASVRPPRWPLGGWRIARTDGAARTLMPSDLHGLDWVARAAVRRAGLRFDESRWKR